MKLFVNLILVLFCAMVNIVGKCNCLDLTILHTNDMHGRFEETSVNSGTCKNLGSKECYGGFARIAHVIRAHRNESLKNPDGRATIFLNAGDTYTGTSWFSVHKWRIAVDFINRLEPECISFGNHEFDYGVNGLMPFLKNLKYPIVAANLDVSKDRDFQIEVKKSHVLQVHGMRIGIIGYILPDTVQLSSTGNVTFLDEVKSINEESKKLEANGVKVIIALGHSGFEMDKKIARECPLVDLVIGGHTNTFMWNGPPPSIEVPEGPYPVLVTQSSGKVVPVVQGYAFTKYIGRLNITINEAGDLIKYEGQPILLDSSIPKAQDIHQALDVYRAGLDEATKKVVGKSKVELTIDKCRLEECNFGSLLSDVYIEHVVQNYAGPYWTDAAVAIVNGGAIRAPIGTGDITTGELLGALPYDMNIIMFGLTGANLKLALENSIRSNGETSRGEFLQVSGLRIVYDISQPVGSRVKDVLVRCANCTIPVYEPLDEKKMYRILSNDFLLSGGDGYSVLKENAINKVTQDTTELLAVVNYISKRQIIYPEVGNRITVLNGQSINGSSSATKFSINLLIFSLLIFGIIIRLF